MRIKNPDKQEEITQILERLNIEGLSLPGIATARSKKVFVAQIIDSIRRITFVIKICEGPVSKERADPTNDVFDPIKASIFHKRGGNIDEAFWLAFLAIHFGKAKDSGWRLVRDIYGSLGLNTWTWERTSQSPEEFKEWLVHNYHNLKNDGVVRKFGNHRKYETLKNTAKRSTGNVIESYINWVVPFENHEGLIASAIDDIVSDDPRLLFSHLYKSMDCVLSFGRTGKFDYLTMLAKLQLVNIAPASTYMAASTGPVKGARLLFLGDVNAKISNQTLEEKLLILDNTLPIGELGMQVLEDALCNWQKSPNRYIYFNG